VLNITLLHTECHWSH